MTSYIHLPSTYLNPAEWAYRPSNVQGPLIMHTFHSETRLADGRPALLIDPASKGNLAGDKWFSEVAEAGARHGRTASLNDRPHPLVVQGVGTGDQECKRDATVPVASTCTDGTSMGGTFTFPIVPNSDLPGLLGLGTMLGKCILDMTSTPMQLHFVGPGTNEMKLSEGTRSFALEQSPSGHLMLPISEFQRLDSSSPALDRSTLNLAVTHTEEQESRTASSGTS